MSRDQDPFDAKVLEILEAVYEAEERGETVDVDSLCGGDSNLSSRVLEVLGRPKRVFGTTGRDDKKKSSADLRAAEIGQNLGQYRITGHIGRGAMGNVYEAIDENTDTVVALKLIGLDAADSVRVLRFEREAAIMRLLSHPNIVPVFAFERDADQAWIAMKRLSGPSLDRLEKRPSVREVARWGVAVARALDRAHQAGIVHRDIKPSNIILDKGEPMVADFGLARGFGDATLTREGAAPGTLPYMPPEVLRGESGLDTRTDIYALGATLYEAVAGHRAFFAPDDAVMIGMILLRDPPPLSMFAEDREFETIILRAMSKEPHRRFARASAFADDLERFLAGRPILSRRPGFFENAIRNIRRRPRTSAALAAAAVISLTVAGRLYVERVDRHRAFSELSVDFDDSLRERRLDIAATIRDNMRNLRIEDDAVATATRRLDAVVAREQLLDQILDRWESQTPEVLDRLVTRIRGFGETERDRTFDLAVAIAELYRQRFDEARATARGVVEKFGASLASDAVLAAADDRLPESKLEPRSADDLVLAACAIRPVRGSLPLRKAWIEQANRRWPGHYRAQFSSIVVLVQEGEYVGAACALTTLAHRDRYHPARSRLEASVDFLTHRSTDARSILASIPTEFRSSFDDLIEIAVARREGNLEQESARLGEALARWPNDFGILRASADSAFRRADTDAVRAAVLRLKSAAKTSNEKDEAAAVEMYARLIELGGFENRSSPLGFKAAAEVEEIVEDCEDALNRPKDPHVASLFEWNAAWGLRLLGRVNEAQRLVRRAAESAENNLAQLAFIEWTAYEIPIGRNAEGRSPIDQAITAETLYDARRCAKLLRRMMDAESFAPLKPGANALLDLMLPGVAIAHRAEDPELAKRCAETLLGAMKTDATLEKKYGPRADFLHEVLNWANQD